MKLIYLQNCKLAFTLVTTIGLMHTAIADVVTEWNTKANEIIAAANLPAPNAYRVMAIVQTSVHDAIESIANNENSSAALTGASTDAAVAAATRISLQKSLPNPRAEVEIEYQNALAKIPDSSAKTLGIEVGETSANKIIVARSTDGATTVESYRPRTVPGIYVPTTIPVTPQWPQRAPWILKSANQYRPAPPPSLKSDRWARDLNESKIFGKKDSTARSEAQTEIARFWETTGPAIYFSALRSVATVSGRSILDNARLFASAAIAMDDALIAVMDAKYHYHFWRPITAIRNADIDDNDLTIRDESWLPLVTTPMHPEYPCAHCVLAGALGAIIRDEFQENSIPVITAISVSAKGDSRYWYTIEDFVQEVADARIYDGVHYRTSTEVGSELGRKVGDFVAKFYKKNRYQPH